jgi:hypothetical protein
MEGAVRGFAPVGQLWTKLLLLLLLLQLAEAFLMHCDKRGRAIVVAPMRMNMCRTPRLVAIGRVGVIVEVVMVVVVVVIEKEREIWGGELDVGVNKKERKSKAD